MAATRPVSRSIPVIGHRHLGFHGEMEGWRSKSLEKSAMMHRGRRRKPLFARTSDGPEVAGCSSVKYNIHGSDRGHSEP